jgi:hypothetical protein
MVIKLTKTYHKLNFVLERSKTEKNVKTAAGVCPDKDEVITNERVL